MLRCICRLTNLFYKAFLQPKVAITLFSKAFYCIKTPLKLSSSLWHMTHRAHTLDKLYITSRKCSKIVNLHFALLQNLDFYYFTQNIISATRRGKLMEKSENYNPFWIPQVHVDKPPYTSLYSHS